MWAQSIHLGGRWAASLAALSALIWQTLPANTAEPAIGLVYASAAQRVATGRHVIAGCVANIGSVAEKRVSVVFTIADPAASILSLRSAANKSVVNLSSAEVGIDSLAPGEIRRFEILVQTGDQLDGRNYKVWVPGGQTLNSNVQFECAPVLAGKDAIGARFVSAGHTLSIAAAADALRQTALIPGVATATATTEPPPGQPVLDAAPLTGLIAIVALLVLFGALVILMRWLVKR